MGVEEGTSCPKTQGVKNSSPEFTAKRISWGVKACYTVEK
jgi:hypothetical protein